MNVEDEVQLHPDRALAHARWLLSRDPARLDEAGRQQRDFLLGDGKSVLDVLENWEREMAEGGAKGYATYLMTVHRVCLRFFGRMLPHRLLVIVWYVLCVSSLALLGVAFWLLVRVKRAGWFN